MIRIAILIGALFLTTPSEMNAHEFKEDVVVIGNTTSSPKDISLKDLRDIFWGRKRTWENGTPIKVYVLGSANPSTLIFYSQNLGILPSTYWSLLFKQPGNEEDIFVPTILPTDAAIYHAVDCTPGAIGYMSSSEFHYHDSEHDLIEPVDIHL